MNPLVIIFHALLLFTISAHSQNASLLGEVSSLADVEQNFANTAISKNIKTAFKAVLSGESIVFSLHPVNETDGYRIDARPDASYLFWKPKLVGSLIPATHIKK